MHSWRGLPVRFYSMFSMLFPHCNRISFLCQSVRMPKVGKLANFQMFTIPSEMLLTEAFVIFREGKICQCKYLICIWSCLDASGLRHIRVVSSPCASPRRDWSTQISGNPLPSQMQHMMLSQARRKFAKECSIYKRKLKEEKSN